MNQSSVQHFCTIESVKMHTMFNSINVMFKYKVQILSIVATYLPCKSVLDPWRTPYRGPVDVVGL